MKSKIEDYLDWIDSCGWTECKHATVKVPPTVIKELVDYIREILECVEHQAEDEGLWFVPVYITESYLQEELRKLHVIIEQDLMGDLIEHGD